MKMGVMSDTHGSLDTMRRAASKMIERFQVDTIIHLGDDSRDVESLLPLPINVYWVPGVFEDRYKDENIPNRIIKEFEDVPFLLTHTPTKDSHDLDSDIDPAQAIQDGDIKVLLHGHSHVWRIQEERGVILVNPGHLMAETSKGNVPTFAVLEVTPKKLEVKIYSLDDALVAEKTFFLEF